VVCSIQHAEHPKTIQRVTLELIVVIQAFLHQSLWLEEVQRLEIVIQQQFTRDELLQHHTFAVGQDAVFQAAVLQLNELDINLHDVTDNIPSMLSIFISMLSTKNSMVRISAPPAS